MKKVVYTTCVDNYFPELCSLTLPNHEAWAKAIGAEFYVINERKFLDWPPTYEKLQIYELGKENLWNIHIDADILIHPKFPDITSRSIAAVHYYSIYDPKLYFRPNPAYMKYFMRDGRTVGICSAFIAVSHLCHDLWTPFDKPITELKNEIHPTTHGIDDYCFSVNFAKFGLKGEFMIRDDSEIPMIQHLEIGGDWGGKKTILETAEKVLKDWSI